MELPKIDVPVYTTELPSTGEVIKFRPFLVKEQKQLLIAQGGDEVQQTQAVEDIVRECTWGAVDAQTAPAYDVEYLFLQIRSRSVGESIDLVLTCGDCGEKQDAKLDLTTVHIDKPIEHGYEIDIGPDLSLSLKDPGLKDLTLLRNEEDNADNIIKLIANCIKTIWKGDESYDVRDYPQAELIEFVENLSPQNFAKLEEFFVTMPRLRHELEFKCNKCESDNRAALEGLQSFFV